MFNICICECFFLAYDQHWSSRKNFTCSNGWLWRNRNGFGILRNSYAKMWANIWSDCFNIENGKCFPRQIKYCQDFLAMCSAVAEERYNLIASGDNYGFATNEGIEMRKVRVCIFLWGCSYLSTHKKRKILIIIIGITSNFFACSNKELSISRALHLIVVFGLW